MAANPLERYMIHRSSTLDRRVSLRPMTSTEVVDFSLRVYQSLGWTILKLTAIPTTFIFGGLAFLLWIVLPKLGVTSDPTSVKTQVGEALMTLGIAVGVAIPVIMIGFAYSSILILKLVANYIEGSAPDPQAALRVARQSLKSTLGLIMYEVLIGFSGILASTFLLLGSAFLDSLGPQNQTMSGLVAGLAVFGFIAGILVFLTVIARHALSGAAVVLEGRKPRDAARRSVELMRATKSHPSGYGSVWMAFFVIGMLSVVLLPAFYGMLGLFDLRALIANFSGIPLLGEALSQMLNLTPLFLFVWAAAPIWCATIAILYFERRIRLEGYDIESLARDMVRQRKENRFEF